MNTVDKKGDIFIGQAFVCLSSNTGVEDLVQNFEPGRFQGVHKHKHLYSLLFQKVMLLCPPFWSGCVQNFELFCQ